MPTERHTLTQQELAEVLQRLDEVMAEAERLRRQVTMQLSQHRSDQQQKLTSGAKSKTAKPGKRGSATPARKGR